MYLNYLIKQAKEVEKIQAHDAPPHKGTPADPIPALGITDSGKPSDPIHARSVSGSEHKAPATTPAAPTTHGSPSLLDQIKSRVEALPGEASAGINKVKGLPSPVLGGLGGAAVGGVGGLLYHLLKKDF